MEVATITTRVITAPSRITRAKRVAMDRQFTIRFHKSLCSMGSSCCGGNEPEEAFFVHSTASRNRPAPLDADAISSPVEDGSIPTKPDNSCICPRTPCPTEEKHRCSCISVPDPEVVCRRHMVPISPVRREWVMATVGMCSICISPSATAGRTAVRLRVCGHYYHCACLKTWFAKKRYHCPMCMRRISSRPADDFALQWTELAI